ncbi:unnamed protein product [Rangifer tarandus platyrhynchus]|uniref:Uncharacterized protein n=1 Tax=Rangifer tarandus platyrhynchus TaxID=3082113 RepID=A0ABN8ZAP6_RANTA|nr:unnamed protein product [Rangifer tarandus platyrhynchus]
MSAPGPEVPALHGCNQGPRVSASQELLGVNPAVLRDRLPPLGALLTKLTSFLLLGAQDQIKKLAHKECLVDRNPECYQRDVSKAQTWLHPLCRVLQSPPPVPTDSCSAMLRLGKAKTQGSGLAGEKTPSAPACVSLKAEYHVHTRQFIWEEGPGRKGEQRRESQHKDVLPDWPPRRLPGKRSCRAGDPPRASENRWPERRGIPPAPQPVTLAFISRGPVRAGSTPAGMGPMQASLVTECGRSLSTAPQRGDIKSGGLTPVDRTTLQLMAVKQQSPNLN